MITTFSKHGKGKGYGPISYVCSGTKKDGTQRSVAPRVLEGEARTTRRLIDACPHDWKYTSLVISFTPEEFTETLARSVINDFKKAAFPGLAPHQFDLLAVLHGDTENPHLHILTPRLELTTRRAFNIAPPGSQQTYWRRWSEMTREKHQLEPVVKPHQLDEQPYSKFERKHINRASLENFPLLKLKKIIHEIISENVASGLIENREDLIDFFKGSGFEISRITGKSISIKTDTKNIRFEGGIYERPNTGDKTTYREIAEKSRELEIANNRDLREKSRTTSERFNTSYKSKQYTNAKVYGNREPKSSACDKKIFCKNERETGEDKTNDFDNMRSHNNRAHSHKNSISFSKDLDSLIIAATINNWNASTENSLDTEQHLSELQFAKAMQSADSLVPRYRP